MPAYDPLNCCKSFHRPLSYTLLMFFISLAFDIQCAVRRPDGANAPFVILSTATLDEIRSSVAEKLNRYHGRISLQYRLDSDKAQTGATLIHTDDELALFKTRMRTLIVPPLLANGKPSNRALKSVRVLFEDTGAIEDRSVEPSIGKGVSRRLLLFESPIHHVNPS